MTAPTPPPDGYNPADNPNRPHLNVLRYLAERYGHPERWTLIFYRGNFYVWTGTFWKLVDARTIESQLYIWFETAVWWDPGNQQRAAGWKDFDINPAKRRALFEGLSNRTLLDRNVDMPVWLVPGDENKILIDPPMQPLDIIVCQNGLLHAPDRLLWRHTPRLFNTFCLGHDYISDALMPGVWLAFLRSIWDDDQESIDTLQEMFGYLLTHRNDLQKMFVLYGSKRGGKGTIIKVLQALLGQGNTTPTSMSDMSTDFGLSNLDGKAMAFMSDLRFRGRDDGVAVERLLKISGDDTVMINRKYREPYEAHLACRFLIVSNELPQLYDESGALQSRMIMLRFEKNFQELGVLDSTLQERLLSRDVLPGVLTWALQGLDRLNARGCFVQPESGAEELVAMEELSSPTLRFITECCEVGRNKIIPRQELFSAWKVWCSETDHRSSSDSSFGRNLTAAVPSVRRTRPGPKGKQIYSYDGVALNERGLRYLAHTSFSAGYFQRNIDGVDNQF